MQQTILEGFAVDVQDMPDSSKALVLTEVAPQTGQVFVLPLPKDVLDEVAKKLQGSGIVTAPASALRVIQNSE